MDDSKIIQVDVNALSGAVSSAAQAIRQQPSGSTNAATDDNTTTTGKKHRYAEVCHFFPS